MDGIEAKVFAIHPKEPGTQQLDPNKQLTSSFACESPPFELGGNCPFGGVEEQLKENNVFSSR